MPKLPIWYVFPNLTLIILCHFVRLIKNKDYKLTRSQEKHNEDF